MTWAAVRRAGEGVPQPAPPVLLVEAEALLATDPAAEAALALLRRDPFRPLRRAAGLDRDPDGVGDGAAGLPDPRLLPLDPEVLRFLEAERVAGRRLVLFGRAWPGLARALAERVGWFEGVLDPEETRPERLRGRLGGAFVLLARDRPDPSLLRSAAGLVLREDALPPPGSDLSVVARIARSRPPFRLWLRALRLHQWAKNLLVFVPVLLAGPLATAADYGRTLLAFLALGLLASAGYLVNDLLDLEADRRHPEKRTRPFAAGTLPLRSGIVAVPVLLAAAAALSLLLPRAFAIAAGGYLVLTLAYSLALKRVALLDVFVLGGLFSLRVLAGAEVISTPLSYWLLTFSMFFFLSLALVKRHAELDQLARRGGVALDDRGGYATVDLPLLMALGLATAVAATLIFVVYLVAEQFPRAIYSRPGWLWFVFPILLLWLVRVWRLAIHGRMSQDPVLFALTDRPSLAMAAAVLACLLAAW